MAERVDERLATCAVDLERLRLPPGAVEREHELAPRSLAERVGRDERGELLEDLRMPAESEVGLDPVLERGEPQLLEPVRSLCRERLACEVGQRGPAPLGERSPQQLGSPREVAARDRASPRGGSVLEA